MGHGDRRRRARLENDAATKLLRLAMEKDEERKSRLEKMVAITQFMLAQIKYVAMDTHSMQTD